MPALCSGILGGFSIWQLVLLAYMQLFVHVHRERLTSITTKSLDKKLLEVCRCPFFKAFNSVGAKQRIPLWPLKPARACQSSLRFYLFCGSLWMPRSGSGSRLSVTLKPLPGMAVQPSEPQENQQASVSGTGHWWLVWSPTHPTSTLHNEGLMMIFI